MPKGPRGEKRPGDVIGAAIMVAKIATGAIAGLAWNAQKSGQIRMFGGRFVPEPPKKLIRRDDDPKGFQDALFMRWVGTGVFAVAGVICIIAERFGFSN
jgi:hypothetical protein